MRVFSFSKGRGQPPAPPKTGAERLAADLRERAQASAQRGYAAYLVALFRRTSPYALWRRARTAFAPAIFLSRALRILRITLRILEASALFLFAAALLLFITPFLLLALLLSVLHATLTARRTDRRLAPFLEGQRVLVLFSATAAEAPARALTALSAEYTVLVVLPLFGGAGKRLSLLSAARREGGVILLREHYYFHISRHLLTRAAFLARIW